MRRSLVTGLAVDKDDNVWVLDRPKDLRDMELRAELANSPADCCTRPPSMIHIDKNGDVIGSFDAPEGHGLAVDSSGEAALGPEGPRLPGKGGPAPARNLSRQPWRGQTGRFRGSSGLPH